MNMFIYDHGFQKTLFDRMAVSYERVNLLTSFGLCDLWRRACTKEVHGRVLDLMAGSGELWPYLTQMQSMTAVDFSPVSCQRARASARQSALPIAVLESDVLATSLPDSSFDTVICGFGIKTLTEDQKVCFAQELMRLLRAGGSYRLIEVTVPHNPLWRAAYLAYLRFVVPLAGKLLLGDPACYRMLYHYTVASKNLDSLAVALRGAGLTVETTSLFWGGATLLTGKK